MAQSDDSSHFRLLTRGDSAYSAFDNKLAIDLYREAFLRDSSFVTRLRLSRTYYDYGLDLRARSKHDRARAHFEESILHAQHLVDNYPDSALAHFMLAATMGNLAQFESGQRKVEIGRMVEQHSRQAIALDSTSAYPYVSLGIYFRELSRLGWFEKTLAKMFYGRIPNVSENDVLDLLLHAAKIKPDFPFLHYELGMTYMTFDRPAEALEHFNILISLEPETSQDIRNQENARSVIADLRANQ